MSLRAGSHWWYLFHKEVEARLYNEFDNLNPQLNSGIFKCISWLNGLFCWGWGFLEEGVKTYPMAPMLPLNSPTYFLASRL
jgi:hypothetical protein